MYKLSFTPQELVALKKEHAPNATQEQFDLWMAECRNRKAAPVHDVYLQIRSVKEWDEDTKTKVFKKKAIYGTTIGFLRTIAQRSGNYAGQLPTIWIYEDGKEYEVALKGQQPYAAKVSVLRTGWAQPITVVARWDAYAQTYKDNKDGKEKLNPTWALRGPEQLEKCAEALALRKAFPEEASSLYLPEEIKDETDVTFAAPRKKNGNGKKHEHQGIVDAYNTTVDTFRNTHGVEITDADVPDNIGTPSAQDLDTVAKEEEIREATGRATEEERKGFAPKLRKFADIVGTQNLKVWATNEMGDPRTASKLQWDTLIAKLEACPDNQTLKTLVGEVPF
jgi:hypothetical protein